LKPDGAPSVKAKNYVAPRAGAWIETKMRRFARHYSLRRPPRGGVD